MSLRCLNFVYIFNGWKCFARLLVIFADVAFNMTCASFYSFCLTNNLLRGSCWQIVIGNKISVQLNENHILLMWYAHTNICVSFLAAGRWLCCQYCLLSNVFLSLNSLLTSCVGFQTLFHAMLRWHLWCKGNWCKGNNVITRDNAQMKQFQFFFLCQSHMSWIRNKMNFNVYF